MRQFRDDAGVEWKVFLTPRGSDAVSREHFLPESFREGWLVFESATEKRRLAPVPADWEELSADELKALCGKASPQTARARSGAGGDQPKPVARAAATAPTVDTLRPQLYKAERQLDQTISEVCETPVASELGTGELIRVEETLAMAAEAAKEAVSLRRKMRADRQRAEDAGDDEARSEGGPPPG